MRIDRIELGSFRGATQRTSIDFHRPLKLAVIFGENGTGKSSIVDGLDLVCNERIGSLEDRSIEGTTKKHKHLAALGKQLKDVLVFVHSGTDVWKGTLTKEGTSVEGPSPRPALHVLRRTRLLKLLEAKPAERYSELKGFVEVEGVEAAEDALRKACDSATAKHNDAVRRHSQAKHLLDQIWAQHRDGSDADGIDAISWARRRAALDCEAAKATKLALDSVCTEIDSLTRLRTALLNGRRALEGARDALTSYSAAAVEGDKSHVERDGELVELLATAQDFLQKHSSETQCPVCEKPNEAESLARRLAQRQARMREISKSIEDRASLVAELRKSEATYSAAVTNLVDTAVSLLERVEEHREPIGDIPEFGSLVFALIKSSSRAYDEPTAREAETLADVSAALLTRLRQTCDDLSEHLAQVKMLQENVKHFDESAAEIADLEAKKAILAAAHTVVHDERVQFVQQVLDEVSGECNRIYGVIHPGERIGMEAMTIDPKKRGSVTHSAHFEGHKDLPPTAYFSESHVDTLGLAMFMAIAKRQSGSSGVLVLDDVFTSVDGPHMDRIVNLLAEEADQFEQIIVTTHFRRMYEKFRLGQGDKADLKELARWRFADGVTVYDGKVELDVLRALLLAKPFDRQAVASKAGFILDSTLDHLVLKYRCRTPKVPGGANALRELYDGFAPVAKLMKVSQGTGKGAAWSSAGAEVAVQPLYEMLKNSNLIRNEVGAHYNLEGFDVSDPEVEEFGSNVLGFVDAISCASCKGLPLRKKPSWWECPCGACRTIPVERP